MTRHMIGHMVNLMDQGGNQADESSRESPKYSYADSENA